MTLDCDITFEGTFKRVDCLFFIVLSLLRAILILSISEKKFFNLSDRLFIYGNLKYLQLQGFLVIIMVTDVIRSVLFRKYSFYERDWIIIFN